MKCIYPGSFDPITLGHLELVERASRLFDQVVVAVLVNPAKKGFLPMEKRLELIRQATLHLGNVTVDSFGGLLADYVAKVEGDVILRGVRSLGDCIGEIPAAQCNRRLNEKAETLMMVSSPEMSDLSSSAVREIFSFGGDVSSFVPECVLRELKTMRGEK